MSSNIWKWLARSAFGQTLTSLRFYEHWRGRPKRPAFIRPNREGTGIPVNRMKAHREHRAPLCDRALEILQALPHEADYVFPGSTKGVQISNMAMTSVLRRMKRDDITVHGFRSTFRDWAAEKTTHANHIVEMALAHVIGDKVEAAYRRGDLLAARVHLMADWARYCTTPPADATVMPIRARG